MAIRPKRILAQTLKELTQLGRDRLTLALALVLPLLMLLLFGFAVSLDVKDISLAIQDLDGSPASREYIATFERTNKFRLVAQGPEVNVAKLLDQGRASAGLIIPPEFSRDLRRQGREAEVQILLDGTDANTANIVRGNAKATTNAFVTNLQVSSRPPAVQLQSRLWYNPGLETLKYIGPGAMAVALTLFPPLIAGLATAREHENGTITQVYASSLTGTEYLLGKGLAYWLVGMAEVLLVNLTAYSLFRLWFVGDPTPLILGSLLYIACGVFWGIFIGSGTKSQGSTIQAVTLSAFLLSLLMSEYIYPVSNIPWGLRWVSALVPARYYILLTRDAFARGVGWPAVWLPVLALAGLASLFFFLAWRKLRKMQVE
ncbi:ABC transporter permease [Leptolyngbya sp. FACHB-261]|uniref:ABC transporter permease n=1 Tax=Leptolyngbya sp. FACHB-261 TaxID=2692806 RepID=UPI001681C92F|nr:ABC transporter permease [Leptolyngbya sp. FACHB-261]MBD2101473.1 ABC transporter permease [Leptolyngbya sp. FACHB-261]